MQPSPTPTSKGALEAREATLWRRYKTFMAVGVTLFALLALLSTRSVERLFPATFPDWASATLVVGLLGGSLATMTAAGVFLKLRNRVVRQIAEQQA